MLYRQKLLLLSKLSLFFLVLLIILVLVPMTLSKYDTVIQGEVNSNIAFYLFKDEYITQNVKLSTNDISSSFIISFTIGNQKNSKVSDVDIEYILKIVTTTNLPFRYELFMNENFDDTDAVNLIQSSNTVVEQDEDGTYFQTFTFENETLLYQHPKTNQYTLVVYTDNFYRDSKFQDMIESIRFIVDSNQVID